jgi:phage shock protein E
MFRLLSSVSVLMVLLVFSSDIRAEEAFWIDVRTAEEYQAEHVSQAANIPYTEIAERIAEVTEDKDAPIYVYCRSGRRSGIAMEALNASGYTNVSNAGGLQDALARAGETTVQ